MILCSQRIRIWRSRFFKGGFWASPSSTGCLLECNLKPKSILTCLFPLLVINWHLVFYYQIIIKTNWLNDNIGFFIQNIFHRINKLLRSGPNASMKIKRSKFKSVEVSWDLSDHFFDLCCECVILIFNGLPVCKNEWPEEGIYTPNCSSQVIICFYSCFEWSSFFKGVFVAKNEKWFTLGRFLEYFRLC